MKSVIPPGDDSSSAAHYPTSSSSVHGPAIERGRRKKCITRRRPNESACFQTDCFRLESTCYHFLLFLPLKVGKKFKKITFFFPAVSGQAETSGPVFVEEPPVQVDFSNTTGTEVVCQSRGTPMPKIQWVRASDGEVVRDVPGLRQVRQKNKSIVCHGP